MPNEPDYKAAYETLLRAIKEADHILFRAQVTASAGLRMQNGEDLPKEDLELIRALNRLA